MPDDRFHPEPPSDDEIEARFRRLQKELEAADLPEVDGDEPRQKMPGPDDDPEFAARLRDLETRHQKAQEAQAAAKVSQERTQRQEQMSSKGLGVGLSIAYTILGLPMLGAGIGWLLDQQLGTKYWVGMATVFGAALGIVMAIIMINRTNNHR